MTTFTMGTRTFRALGTFATLLVTDPGTLARAHTLLAAELAAMDAACSRFRSDSELWRVNHARGRPVQVSALFAEALSVALAAAALTDGDVDPTCGGSLIRLGYDQDFARARRDTGPLRQPPLPAGGWRRVTLDPDRREVTVPDGVMLDLGATAKALAADRAAAAIAAAVGGGVLVNLGGDIRVAGDPPAGGWLVGIADDVGFDAGADSIQARQVVTIRDGGLATSSPLGRAWRRDGADLHHIIDPVTGWPADSCWRTVSVAAASCVDANIASTAAILRGGRAPGWLDVLRLPARLVRRDGTTVTVERTVSGIIREARRPTGDGTRTSCDAAEVIAPCAAFWWPLAEDQNRRMTVELAPGPVPVMASRDDLAACADILLENVFAHTPEGTAFAVRLGPRPGGGAWLVVTDDGPGFGDADPTQRGVSRGGSAGLGLDIARRIAEASGGSLMVGRSASGGGAVTVGLGSPAGRPQAVRAHGRSRLRLRA